MNISDEIDDLNSSGNGFNLAKLDRFYRRVLSLARDENTTAEKIGSWRDDLTKIIHDFASWASGQIVSTLKRLNVRLADIQLSSA